jgi:hypothetical protein
VRLPREEAAMAKRTKFEKKARKAWKFAVKWGVPLAIDLLRPYMPPPTPASIEERRARLRAQVAALRASGAIPG